MLEKMDLQDVLIVRNVYEDAERAKNKKAPLGTDITIENYTNDNISAFDVIDDLDDLAKKDQDTLLSVGVDTSQEDRAGSFVQMDQSNIFTAQLSSDVEVMNTGVALDKYPWVKDYLWNAVKSDQDKYTAEAALREKEEGEYNLRISVSQPTSLYYF